MAGLGLFTVGEEPFGAAIELEEGYVNGDLNLTGRIFGGQILLQQLTAVINFASVATAGGAKVYGCRFLQRVPEYIEAPFTWLRRRDKGL